MLNFAGTLCRWVFSSLVVLEMISAAAGAADLSRYRNFQLGTDLPAVARQTGVSVSEAKVIHYLHAVFASILLAALSGCGGGGSQSTPIVQNAQGTPAGTYVVTVSGTCPNGSNSTTVTLIVK